MTFFDPRPFGGGGILGGFVRQAANEPDNPPDPSFKPSPPGPNVPIDPSELPGFRPPSPGPNFRIDNGKVVIPFNFSDSYDSLLSNYLWNKLLFDPKPLHRNRFYHVDNTDVPLPPNYLDPTPVQGWRPIPYK